MGRVLLDTLRGRFGLCGGSVKSPGVLRVGFGTPLTCASRWEPRDTEGRTRLRGAGHWGCEGCPAPLGHTNGQKDVLGTPWAQEGSSLWGFHHTAREKHFAWGLQLTNPRYQTPRNKISQHKLPKWAECPQPQPDPAPKGRNVCLGLVLLLSLLPTTP